jgi:hypothetical protein
VANKLKPAKKMKEKNMFDTAEEQTPTFPNRLVTYYY